MKSLRINDIAYRWLIEPVPDVSEEERSEIPRWTDRLRNACALYDGYAVAGPQISINRRIIGFRLPGMPKVLVNPTVRPLGDELAVSRESCLSIVGFTAMIERPARVEVVDGVTFDAWVFDGLAAVVVQHEVDHLNGISLFDRLSERDLAAVSRSPLYKKWLSSKQK